MSQIFLYVSDGRTLWVPTHQASPAESGSVVMLRQVTQAELVRSFYLFDTTIQLVDDPRMSSAYAKTPSDVLAAVGAFRDRCTRDEHFMMSSRYNPSAPRPASAAPPQPMQQQQLQAPIPQQQGYGAMGGGAYGMAPPMMGGGMMHQGYQQQQPLGGYSNMMPQPYGGGYPQQPPQRGGPMAPGYGSNAPSYGGGYGGGSNYGSGGNMAGGHYGGGGQQRHGGGAGHAHQQPHGGGSAQQQQGSRFQQVVFEKPQPIDVPIEIPKDVWDLYHQPNGRLYCATMPGARITLWLRNHTMAPSNYQRYVHCKNGVSLMMKAAAADVLESKPVELFDRQLCTHFLAHNYCSRQGCLHVHHSETQVRHMIAAKHVLLQDTTKREREQMVEDIVAKDRAAASRPKEDFETRYAIVMAMPPTYVTGTPIEKLRGIAVAEDATDVQIAPNVVGGDAGSHRPPPHRSSRSDMPRGDDERGGSRRDDAPSAPAHKPSQRFTGPIGVVSDSETDSSDTDSSDSDSGSDSSSSSSSAESDASGKSGGSGKAEGTTLSEEEQRAAAEVRLREKEAKKRLRAMVEKMKDERVGIDKSQKKAFRSITKAADDDRHQIRKREKKERKRQDKDERKRSRGDDDERRSDRRRSRSDSRRRSDRR